jgi:hypothetical protein
MDDTDSDTPMIIAGLVLSAIAALELYTSVKRARERNR